MRHLLRLLLAILLFGVFLVVGVAVPFLEVAVAAGPANCMFPNTSGRANLLYSWNPSTPAACAMNICRTIGYTTNRILPCEGGPSCANQPPRIDIYQAASGGWGTLPACPGWTNTSAWVAP